MWDARFFQIVADLNGNMGARAIERRLPEGRLIAFLLPEVRLSPVSETVVVEQAA
jgi:hypothetical protein